MLGQEQWFLVPAVSDGTTGVITPKYSDNAEIIAFAGTIVSDSVVSDQYSQLAQTDPDSGMWYVVRFYEDDGNGGQALQSIGGNNDAKTLQNPNTELGNIINAERPEGEGKPGDEWESSYEVTETDNST